jgi:hypothetical protein
MPSTRPGTRVPVVRSNKTAARGAAGLDALLVHGQPAVDQNFAGIGFKNAQPDPMAVSTANALIAQQIATGENYVIDIAGAHEVDPDLLPAGAAAGDPLYIRVADDVLVNAAEALTDPDGAGGAGGVIEAGYRKFGRLETLDNGGGLADVNLNERGSL